MSARPAIFAAASLMVAARVMAADPPIDKGRLEPGGRSEQEIAVGTDHAWSLAAVPGQVHEVRVTQIGADLEVRWTSGGATRRVNRSEGWSGEEVVWWVAGAEAATDTITVKLAAQRGGRYSITLAAPRPATAADHERHEAEKGLFGGNRAAVEKAAQAFARLAIPDRQLLALQRLADLARMQGDLPVSRKAGEECVGLARAGHGDHHLAKCLIGLADTLDSQGDLAAATAAWDEALALRERAGDPGPIAVVLHDSANLLILQGEYDRAEAQLHRAAALGREAGSGMTAMATGLTLGVLAGYRGDPEAAVAAFEDARALAEVHGRTDQKVVVLVNLGVAYAHIGDFGRSSARLREAIELAESNQMKPAVAFGRLALGGMLEEAGELEAAAVELQAAATLARESGDARVEAEAEAFLGWVLARQGKGDAAITHADTATSAAARGGDPLRIANAALYRGMVLTTARRHGDAGAALRSALAGFEGVGHPEGQARTQVALARLAQQGGDLAAALEHVERGLAGFESVRTQVALADQRAQYMAFRREAFDLAVDILLGAEARRPGRGFRERAFEMTERSRARSFLEEIQRAHAGASKAPPELARAHRAALDRLAFLQRDLIERRTGKGERDPVALAALEKDLETAVAREETARRALREASGAGAVAAPAPLALETVLGRLAAGEAVLEYHVGRERSWLFALTRQGLAVHPLPGDAELRRDVDALRRLLARPAVLGAAAYSAAARALHSTLVAPALPRLAGVRRLRVVPDGPLWELPFDALVTGPGKGAGYAGLPFAVRRWQFVYHPSAAVAVAVVAAQRAGAAGAPQLIAFANPMSGDPPARAVAAVERAIFREGDTWSLPPLPCAEQEARGAAALFQPAGARVFTGADARESRVKGDPEVARARYLLFSTHALLSETLPSQSSLVMALQGDGNEDGLLQVHEIEALRLEADLVVLSACESAMGRNLKGEGLLGLSRGFFHAGARALLATLWKVADCSTADLSLAFFSKLAGSPRPDAAAALREAKLKLLGRPATAHPYHWAPFVLLGASAGDPAHGGPRRP